MVHQSVVLACCQFNFPTPPIPPDDTVELRKLYLGQLQLQLQLSNQMAEMGVEWRYGATKNLAQLRHLPSCLLFSGKIIFLPLSKTWFLSFCISASVPVYLKLSLREIMARMSGPISKNASKSGQ